MTTSRQDDPVDSPGHRGRPQQTLQEMLQLSRQRQAEISALLSCSRAVLEYREFPDAARAIFDSCKTLIGATSGYVALLSQDGSENEVLFLDSGGLSCTVDPSLPMPIRGLRERAYREGKAVFDNDFSRGPWVAFLPQGHAKLDNVLFAPLMMHGRVAGLLGIANKLGGFTDHDARLASGFGELAAISLHNSRTLEALESSEQRFRSLTQSAGDGIVSTDRAGGIVYCNDAAQEMFGYAADEILGKPLASVIPARFHQAHQRGIQRVVSTGEPKIIGKTVEVVGLKADGSEFPVELSLSTWKSKEETFFTGILRDVTRRRQAQQRNDTILRTSMDGFWVIDLEGNVLEVNDAYCRLIGHTRDELLTMNVRDLEVIESPEEIRRHVLKLRETGSDRFETRHRRRDGSAVDLDVSANYLPIEGGRICTFLRDITRQKRVEEALRESEELHRITLGSISDAVFITDDSGAFAFVCPNVNVIFGYSREEVVAQGNIQQLLGKDLFDPGELKRCGELSNIERMARDKAGSEHVLLVTVKQVAIKGGTVLITCRDITERKRAEEQVGLLAAFPSENPDPVMRVGQDGTLIYANQSSRRLLDSWDGGIGRVLSEPLATSVSRVFASDRREDVEVQCDGRTIVIRLVPVVEAGYVNLYGRDITERRLASHFLEIANRHVEMRPLLEEFVAEMKRFTGCPAVGIRVLDEDGNIPYAAYDGFPQRFYELESPLSIDSDRCMCISVVKGETDPRLPHFSQGGSFWTNQTTRFLATATEEEKGETRNACNQFGYESVLLVPIRLDSRVLGLIHVADTRENAIARDVVESLERLGMLLGTALQRVRAEEALRAANEQLDARVRQRTAELEKANRELQSQATERQRLEKQVLEIGTGEKRRIGQEIHDGLGQELTGLGYLATSLHRKLQAAGSKEGKTAAELAKGIPRVLGQVQAIVKGLVPLEIGAEDLLPALQALTANVEERTGISCSFQSSDSVRVRDDNAAVQLYRIAQEAVTNAVKHGQAKHIEVAIRADRGRTILEVRDDGAGITPGAEKAPGSGMHIMRYRARAIGGTLDVKSRAGGGTTVCCSLACEPSDELP